MHFADRPSEGVDADGCLLETRTLDLMVFLFQGFGFRLREDVRIQVSIFGG